MQSNDTNLRTSTRIQNLTPELQAQYDALTPDCQELVGILSQFNQQILAVLFVCFDAYTARDKTLLAYIRETLPESVVFVDVMLNRLEVSK